MQQNISPALRTLYDYREQDNGCNIWHTSKVTLSVDV